MTIVGGWKLVSIELENIVWVVFHDDNVCSNTGEARKLFVEEERTIFYTNIIYFLLASDGHDAPGRVLPCGNHTFNQSE